MKRRFLSAVLAPTLALLLILPAQAADIGFDDVAYGLVSDPPLSTVHVYKQELGARAVRELLSAEGKDSKAKVKIQVCAEFVERGSVREVIPGAG